MTQPKIGLALGGGGARGFAHIGVLQVLQEAGIRLDYLAGTSMGAVVGAMYAESLDAFQVEDRWKEFLESETYQSVGIPQLVTQDDKETGFWDQVASGLKKRYAMNVARNQVALIKSERLRRAVEHLITIPDFSQCRLPLTVVATDLISGEDLPITSGDLHQAVTASSSIPGFLPPITYDGRLLSDGGVSCPIPIRYARGSKSTRVIGVGVPPPAIFPSPPENALEIFNRAEQITSRCYSRMQMQEADVAIFPELENVHWYEFGRMQEIIQAGRHGTEALLPVIDRMLFGSLPVWQKTWIALTGADVRRYYRGKM